MNNDATPEKIVVTEEELRRIDEFLYRSAMDMFFLFKRQHADIPLCRVRECRRRRLCSGPMLRCDRPFLSVLALMSEGGSRRAVTELPLCLALGSDELDDLVRDLVPELVDAYGDNIIFIVRSDIRLRRNRRTRRRHGLDLFARRRPDAAPPHDPGTDP
ncbi:hypothetical protein [Ciceribacter sp. L1K22]|uniref:hypothetical protein n=1 Tax=Ciceribacter sp. L1K22 TaxID=2820275 RepID=UPI001ABEA745|nr:hypothetical protein [Ciceribacter sp. L1K22]MBO3762348.1 hypothetical protein [Ciceribacter sp. L1K22]